MAAWTHDENKLFELGIADFDHESPDFYENIRELVPNKTIQEVEEHYQALAIDLQMIESGLYDYALPPMIYVDQNIPIMDQEVEIKEKSRGAWNADERGEFLRGLEKHGRGNWKEIAREFLPGRKATQVASHAQKYFKKINKQQKQDEEENQHRQQQECSSSNAKKADAVLDRNIWTSSLGCHHGPGISDIDQHQH